MELQLLFLLTLPSLLGLISFSKTLLSLLNWAWVTFFRPPKDLKRCYGSWALVTGAADGIGKAISIELANRSLNLILLDRDAPRLETTAKEILNDRRHDVEVRTLVSDLSKDSGSEIVRKIREVIEGLDVGVLINNAGTTHQYPMFFDEVESGVVESMVRVNVEAATWVTKAVLPGMLERRRGAVVNIGSASAWLPALPLYTLYSATKAYINMFSRSMSLEYKRHGIDVQCQVPLFVVTKLSGLWVSPSMWAPSPTTFSKASVDRIGYKAVCSPYWPHSLQWYAISLVPQSLMNWFAFKLALTRYLKENTS